MLTACAAGSSSQANKLANEPQVIEHVKDVPVCPVEATADVPALPVVPDGAVISANQPGQDFVSALWAYAFSSYAVRTDIKTACPPAPQVPHG